MPEMMTFIGKGQQTLKALIRKNRKSEERTNIFTNRVKLIDLIQGTELPGKSMEKTEKNTKKGGDQKACSVKKIFDKG